jgi:hypothetical protein
MSDFGIKVTRDGYGVSTGVSTPTDIQKYALLSSVNLLKIKQVGRVSIGPGATTNIAHNLAYKPLFWCFFKNSSNQMQPAYHSQEQDGVAYIDSTNLVLYNRSGSNTYDFYYYLFYDPV